MKIGLICALYNSIEYVEKCFSAWIAYRSLNPGKLVIICIDTKFKETEDNNPNPNSNDGTLELLNKYKEDGLIDYVITAPPGLMEHESRNLGLEIAKKEGCDLLASVGSDERFLYQDIESILEFIKKKKFICYFKLNYKNYVFDDKHFIEGFSPSRFWRINYGDMTLKEFYMDDDLSYTNGSITVHDKALACLTIPKSVAFVSHDSWNSPQRSKAKCLYQMSHFSKFHNGDESVACAFKWNEEKGNIEWNMAHFNKIQQSPPEVLTDE
jgi:hypothetical protein